MGKTGEAGREGDPIMITELIENAHCDSETKFRDLVENTGDIIWEMDGHFIYTYCSPNIVSILGYAPEELLGKTLFDFMPSGEAKRVGDLFGRIAAEQRPFALLTHKACHKNGGTRVLESSGKPVFDEAGRFRGFRGVDRDITRRERAEEALEQFNELILNSVGEGIYGLDLQGRPTFVNPAVSRMTGWRTEDLLGRPLHEILHHSRPDRTPYPKELCRICAVFQEGALSRADNEVFWRKDGTSFPVEYLTTPIRGERGEAMGVVVTFQDITDRKKLEEQLRQSQKMEAVGRLAGGIAHDFNNMLTVITGYSELLLQSLAPGSPLRNTVEQIKQAGERAAGLTGQLLAFSRKQVLQTKVLDLNAVVADMDKMLRRVIGEDIDLLTVLKPGLGRVKADPGQLEQVMLNLAVNARDAMPQGGKLTIETADVELDAAYARRHVTVKPGPYVMLAVSDTGCGMDAETQARVFEPFFTTKEQGKGTGLGLSTVYGIVQQSGGNIWIYSEPGRGTTFKIYLPKVEEAADMGDPVVAHMQQPRGTETILLVEDNPNVLGLARTVLQGQGYSVLEAPKGERALEIREQHNGAIHLLVTDVVMPGMSGRELAERLATSYPEMKVLYLSGYTDESIVHHGVLDHGMAFLQKPFTPDALARKVREVLDSPARV
jgi:PAS domain S-box-containing protein